MFYEFLKIQYGMGKITREELDGYVPRFLSAEQVKEITGGEGI